MIYRLHDLKNFMPKRKTYGVLGNPVGHSISPELHSEIFKLKRLDYDYIRIELSENEFTEALEIIRDKLCGFNCTIPFKSAILPYLDYSDARVKLLNACNTVNIKQGKLYGYNTDGYGFMKALELKNIALSDKRVLILGAGGAATAVAYEAAINKAKITCAARDVSKARDFACKISQISGSSQVEHADINNISGSFDIIINTTPVGMHPRTGQTPVSINSFTGVEFIYDCIYNPPMTKLLSDATGAEIPVDNGLSMLVLQGLGSESYWNDLSFSDSEALDILEKMEKKLALLRLNSVRKKSNIALIGFMGCGKTTIGKQLAKRLGMEFIDLDNIIEIEQNMSIFEIFKKYGEDFFRELESKAILECKDLTNTVISTGGGAVIKEENAVILKQNALIIFIDLVFDKIVLNLKGSNNRPLIKNREEVFTLFEKRTKIYEKACDISVHFIENSSEADRVVMSYI